MPLVIFDMPFETAAKYEWLNKILMSNRLGDFVNELKCIHQQQAPNVTATEILGAEIDRFLANGFKSISTINLMVILQHPELLYGLRELVNNQEGSTFTGGKHETAENIKTEI